MPVHRQQPERSEIFIFSGLSLSHRSNSEIAADTLMVFAGESFTEETKDTFAIMLFKLGATVGPL